MNESHLSWLYRSSSIRERQKATDQRHARSSLGTSRDLWLQLKYMPWQYTETFHVLWWSPFSIQQLSQKRWGSIYCFLGNFPKCKLQDLQTHVYGFRSLPCLQVREYEWKDCISSRKVIFMSEQILTNLRTHLMTKITDRGNRTECVGCLADEIHPSWWTKSIWQNILNQSY